MAMLSPNKLYAYLMAALSLFIVLQWGKMILSKLNYAPTGWMQYVIYGILAALVDMLLVYIMTRSVGKLLKNFVIMTILYSIVFAVQGQYPNDLGSLTTNSTLSNIIVALIGALLYSAFACLFKTVLN